MRERDKSKKKLNTLKMICKKMFNSSYNSLSQEVLKQFPNGFKSLLPENEKTDGNQIYVVLELEGPDGFYKKFYPSDDLLKEEVSDIQDEDEIQLDCLNDDSFISKKNIQFKHLVQELIARKQRTIEYIKLLNAVYLDTVRIFIKIKG